ncbi:MAG: hypothetical protein ACI3ZY_05590 [Parabacteroides sp.]
MEGFELIESRRREPAIKNQNNPAAIKQDRTDKILDVAADNMEQILTLAGNIIEIEKMKVVSEACLAKMEEDRKMLLAEAQAYVEKKKADTNSVVEKMNVVRTMMLDFYTHSNGNISGDDFCRIISEMVNQMGKVENGAK